MIGWDPVTRAKRFKLVAQLRRFLVLEEYRRPNLASQCLGLGDRELQKQWFVQHGHEPLVAESFSDPECHAGTVYKVTNWTLAGNTKGYSQKRADLDNTDYYIPNERPATGKKEDSEVSEARKLLKDSSVNLVNKTITLDPLYNKHESLDTYVRKPQQAIRLIQK